MDPLLPPTAREVYAHMNAGREALRFLGIFCLLSGAGIVFFISPWQGAQPLLALILQSGLVVTLIILAFGQIKLHEQAEQQAWQKAWKDKLDVAGYDAALETLRQGQMDPASVECIRAWIAGRAGSGQ